MVPFERPNVLSYTTVAVQDGSGTKSRPGCACTSWVTVLLWSTLLTWTFFVSIMSLYGQSSGPMTALRLAGTTGITLDGSKYPWAQTCVNVPKLTLITPWGRDNYDYLPIAAQSIKWDCITQWIIVYDVCKLHLAKPQMQNNSKVLELFHCNTSSASGNLQRQEGLDRVQEGMVFFLDDDNAMHPAFWPWFATNVSLGHIYTFDQLRTYTGSQDALLFSGVNPAQNCIDTAQVLFDKALVGNVSWNPAEYGADGIFISELVAQHRDKHRYVPEVLAYHNFGQHYLSGVKWTRFPTHNASIIKDTVFC